MKIGVDDASVKMNDIYHILGFKKSLVSISQIFYCEKCVLFCPNDVKELDNVKKVMADVILVGEKRNSLFVMSIGEAYVKKTSQTNNESMWYALLGHLGYQMLQQIWSKGC